MARHKRGPLAAQYDEAQRAFLKASKRAIKAGTRAREAMRALDAAEFSQSVAHRKMIETYAAWLDSEEP